MPDPDGTITAGGANVAAPGPTPVAPDVGDGIAPGPPLGTPDSMGPVNPAPPPTQQPTFFRKLLFSLGQGLIEGTKAGLQAPLSPQGPAIAAQTAINAPQQKREQLTTNQMNDLNVAITQLKLHQTQMITHQMEEGQQNAVYNSGREVTTALMEKGKVDVLATGDIKSVQDEFARRQADAKQSGQGLLPLQILPAAGSSAKDPKYALINVGKDRLTDDMEQTFGASDLGVSKEDFEAAGLTPLNFKAPAGMDQQKALQLLTTQHLNWLTKAQNQMGQYKRQQSALDTKQQESALDRQSKERMNAMRNATAVWKANLQQDRQRLKDEGPTTADRNMADMAATMLPHISELRKEIDDLNRAGVLGEFKGKVLKKATGEYGFNISGDMGRKAGKFLSDIGLINSAMLRTHFGSRGGQQILDKFIQSLNAGQNVDTMMGALDSFEGYAKGYADMRNIGKKGTNGDKKKPGIQFNEVPGG
jgi:hypothetical protein